MERTRRMRSRRLLFVSTTVGSIAMNCGMVCGAWEQSYQLIASDAGGSHQYFGQTVAIDGNIAIIGSQYDADGGQNAGAAYLFDVKSGLQLHKLKAADAAHYDQFGHSVAVNGSVAIVGSPWNDHAVEDSGAAYLFDVASGEQLGKLVSEDAAYKCRFGGSVAISGNLAIVGAARDDEGGSEAGAAYVFDVSTGQQLHKLIAEDIEAGDWFGSTVAIDGDIAIIAAKRKEVAGVRVGAGYLFDVTSGEQLSRLTPGDLEDSENFGESVAISGDLALVGAPGETTFVQGGGAYLFDVPTGGLLLELRATDAAKSDSFGLAVSISGDRAVIGAPRDDDGGSESGSAYIFDITTGQELRKLHASDAAKDDRFGWGVGISGNIAICGAPHDWYMGYSVGAAYIFHRCRGNVNGDETVDILDLLAVLAAWGQMGGDLPEDLNGDGVVDVMDLLIVLGTWGACG